MDSKQWKDLTPDEALDRMMRINEDAEELVADGMSVNDVTRLKAIFEIQDPEVQEIKLREIAMEFDVKLEVIKAAKVLI